MFESIVTEKNTSAKVGRRVFLIASAAAVVEAVSPDSAEEPAAEPRVCPGLVQAVTAVRQAA